MDGGESYQILFGFLKSQAGYPNYVCNSLAQEAGHSVLRLPPYHFELNPIEVAWAQGKEGSS